MIAVRVCAGRKLPKVVDVARLGRLLIFDPTDPITPVGGLPREEQGSYALVVASSDGDLVKMPELPLASNRIERSVEGEWNAGGQVGVQLLTQYCGQPGGPMRATA